MRPAMTDTSRIATAPAPVFDVQTRSQRTMREVRAHANAYAGNGDSPEMQKAIGKLRRVLVTGEPLRPDVPRGYYLNFTI